jgi:hypothetical protein
MSRTILLALLVATMWAPASLRAHHPVVSSYFEDRLQTIEGQLVELRLLNPHSVVYIDTRDESGMAQRYTVEWEAFVQLTRQGVSRDTLRAGDIVVITGNPSRNRAERHLRLRTITRPKDGWRWHGAFE